MISEIVIILNQISACIAFKSVAYKRYVMLFIEKVTFSCEFLSVYPVFYLDNVSKYIFSKVGGLEKT